MKCHEMVFYIPGSLLYVYLFSLFSPTRLTVSLDRPLPLIRHRSHYRNHLGFLDLVRITPLGGYAGVPNPLPPAVSATSECQDNGERTIAHDGQGIIGDGALLGSNSVALPFNTMASAVLISSWSVISTNSLVIARVTSSHVISCDPNGENGASEEACVTLGAPRASPCATVREVSLLHWLALHIGLSSGLEL